jgi:hypothetical protein
MAFDESSLTFSITDLFHCVTHRYLTAKRPTWATRTID